MIVVLSTSNAAGGSCDLTIAPVLANECKSEVSVHRDGDVKYKPDLQEGKQMASPKKLTVQFVSNSRAKCWILAGLIEV